jgi:hypothetical protein
MPHAYSSYPPSVITRHTTSRTESGTGFKSERKTNATTFVPEKNISGFVPEKNISGSKRANRAHVICAALPEPRIFAPHEKMGKVRYLKSSNSTSNTSMPFGAPGRVELS